MSWKLVEPIWVHLTMNSMAHHRPCRFACSRLRSGGLVSPRSRNLGKLEIWKAIRPSKEWMFGKFREPASYGTGATLQSWLGRPTHGHDRKARSISTGWEANWEAYLQKRRRTQMFKTALSHRSSTFSLAMHCFRNLAYTVSTVVSAPVVEGRW